MQKQISELCRISAIVVCTSLVCVASQATQNELNEEEEAQLGSSGYLPAEFWSSREVKVMATCNRLQICVQPFAN